jgi:hypothetical protein
MPLAAEVHVLEREIGCNQHFVSARNVEDGAVVSDGVTGFAQVSAQMTGANLGHPASQGSVADTLDQLEFGEGHVLLQYLQLEYLHTAVVTG